MGNDLGSNSSLPCSIANPDTLKLRSGLRGVRYNPGEVVFSARSKFNGVYVIQRGIAKTNIEYEGKCILASLSLCGDILGIDSLHSECYVSEAVCVQAIDALWIPADFFYIFMRESPEFRYCLECAIGKAISEAAIMMRLLSKNDAEKRVAFLLMKIFQASGAKSGTKAHFSVGLSRAEMGQYLGLRVETISRKLTELCEMGYIRVKGKKIFLRDKMGLMQLSGHFFE